MDRIEAMRAFCRIVELGSFHGAADALGLATTTISGQIQALERVLGAKLLHRTTRKVFPTNEGQAYYLRARTLIDDIDDLESSISVNRGVARGKVVVEMPTPVAIHLVIPQLSDFQQQYPEISLEIRCSERVAGLIQEGVDCAIRGGVIADHDLVARAVGHMHFGLYASSSYLDTHPHIAHPSQLCEHPHLGFHFPATGKRFPPSLHHARDTYRLPDSPAWVFNQGGAVTAATVAGLGIAALPQAEVAALLQAGVLRPVLDGWTLDSMPMSIVYPPTRQLSQRVQAMVRWTTALFAADPLWRPHTTDNPE